MKKLLSNKLLIISLVLVLTVGLSIGVFATTRNAASPENDDEDLTNVTVSLTEAEASQIAMDSVVGGTVGKIELEDENGTIVYGVEINTNDQSLDVKVDANTGTILASDDDHEDSSINDHENDSDDEDSDNVEHENDNEDPEGYED